MQTGFRVVAEIRQRRLEYASETGGENDMIGFGNVNAMRQRGADQLGIDQRSHAADPADAEPGCDIIRTARQAQADRIALLDSCLQRPARIAVDALSEFSVAQRSRVRQ